MPSLPEKFSGIQLLVLGECTGPLQALALNVLAFSDRYVHHLEPDELVYVPCRNTYYVNMTILGGIIVAQILLWLFGIWMIDVKSMVEYQSCPSPDKATHCKV